MVGADWDLWEPAPGIPASDQMAGTPFGVAFRHDGTIVYWVQSEGRAVRIGPPTPGARTGNQTSS